jgi:hypothetical protein
LRGRLSAEGDTPKPSDHFCIPSSRRESPLEPLQHRVAHPSRTAKKYLKPGQNIFFAAAFARFALFAVQNGGAVGSIAALTD